MHRFASLLAIIAGVITAPLHATSLAQSTTGPAVDPDTKWNLYVSEDESAIESLIRDYLQTVKKLTLTTGYFGSDANDLYVRVSFSSPQPPDIIVTIDSFLSSNARNERVITLKAYHVLSPRYKTPEMSGRILAMNNQWMVEKWAPDRILLDKDGDILFESYMNIPHTSVGVHAETVYDALARMSSAWTEYFGRFREQIGDPKE